MRRTALGIVAGSALVGMPVMTAGIASANQAPSHGPSHGPSNSQSCTTTGTASNSPGVSSGNVVQVPAFDCSQVFGSPAVAVTGPFITSPS
ncbi:MAG TPA: chaplin family protein [Actinomycetospora sp.]|uniref:chaplin family protein n=1 Tax=Actinomycetospora sp. TaxID=1872135 RepID=UPI002F409E48